MDTNNEIYRKIHFAVMAIESGARKLGISGNARPIEKAKPDSKQAYKKV